MRVLALEIYGFRGINESRFVFPDQVALVGPNGSGKSTIVDALSLVFGRQKLVRELTQHDFTGSRPQPQDRIRIIATLGGFSSNHPDQHGQWFRVDRAVAKWWNPTTCQVEPAPAAGSELCVQLGYAARFDHEDLEVKQRRYFHDDDVADPFDEDNVVRLPDWLVNEIGFFVLPARRTWAATISFGSELFRRAVATLGGLPATSVLTHLEMLRAPNPALEDDLELAPLINRINTRMAQLLPGAPRLQLRVTSTDSESFLQALVPHYQREEESSLPAARHGTGLVSLQALVLLLEIGRARRANGESFIVALEEPELHVPPGLQRRLIGDAAAVSNQVICTTHAPRVAAFFDAASIQILTRSLRTVGEGQPPVVHLEGRQLAPAPMIREPNALVQLYTDQRTRLVEALMFPRVLVPEGRIDFEWLRLLLDVVETGERELQAPEKVLPPFGAVIGLVPTRDSHVRVTYERLSTLHHGVLVLVDGDAAGDGYVQALVALPAPPRAIVQWPAGWAVEDAVGWAIGADGAVLLPAISQRLGHEFQTIADLIAVLKNDNGREGGLKAHYIAHEEIAGAMKRSGATVRRAEVILDAFTRVALDKVEPGYANLALDTNRAGANCKVYRFQP